LLLDFVWTWFTALMQRLLILLLIFLLPMQVFAGIAESTANAQAPVMTALAYTVQQDDPTAQCNIADSRDLQGSEDNTADDIEMHVDLGDETVPAFPFIFAATAIASVPALSNDKARQPPFLPPAGPPPRA
jgi:hypothetical protein